MAAEPTTAEPDAALELVDHRPGWTDEFRQLAARLRSALGSAALRIDHVGSTSLPAIPAKDILDVQVTVAELAEACAALRSAGFVERSDIRSDHVPPGVDGAAADWSKAYFTEPTGLRRMNIHVRLTDRPNQRYALVFRDYLRSHPQSAHAYGELKRRLASSLANVADYPDVKDPAADLVYLAAEAWARQSGWQPPPSDG